jgi:glycosyltransferase involved in cell wall biosynthesis
MRSSGSSAAPSAAAVQRSGPVLVLPTFGTGGAERVTINLAVELARRGAPVRLLVIDGREELPGSSSLRPTIPDTVEVVDLQRPRARAAALALVRHLRARPATWVMGSHTHTNLLLTLLRPLLPRRTRLVLREPSLPPTGALGLRRTLLAQRLLYRRADLLIASSDPMLERLSTVAAARVPVALLPNPVDADRLRGSVTRPDAPSRGRRVVCVARLVPEKSHVDLLTAFATVAGPADLLVLVGDGPLRAPLEQQARELGLSDRVRFLGTVAAPAVEVARADVLALPSTVEGMPNAVLEALALGTPVLATTDLVTLHELAEELGPEALRLVPRDQLAQALSEVRPSSGQDPRPSLLPTRFSARTVVTQLLDLLDGNVRPDA